LINKANGCKSEFNMLIVTKSKGYFLFGTTIVNGILFRNSICVQYESE